MRILRIGPLAIPLLLAGCVPSYLVRDSLEKGVREYAALLRWKERGAACVKYAPDSDVEECRRRAEQWADVSVTDVRAAIVTYDAEKRVATVRTETDYFILPSATLRTTVNTDTWRHDAKRGRWVNETLPPLPKK